MRCLFQLIEINNQSGTQADHRVVSSQSAQTGAKQHQELCQKLRGHFAYYGIGVCGAAYLLTADNDHRPLLTLYGQKIETCQFTGSYGPVIILTLACLLPLHHPYSRPVCDENGAGGRHVDWKTLLAYITGSVDEQLRLRIEYLVVENGILRNQIKGRLHLSEAERTTLAELGKQRGKQALEEVAKVAKPDTILGWHRQLVAQKFDGSTQRKSLGRPRVDKALEDLVVRMAHEKRRWGYDRLAGALAPLGYDLSDQTVGHILKRRGLPPAPERQKKTTWRAFIRTPMEVLWATDFFTTAVWTMAGLVTYCVLFFMHLETRRVHVAGVTPHPNEQWMMQMARNVTMDEWGILQPGQYLFMTATPSSVLPSRRLSMMRVSNVCRCRRGLSSCMRVRSALSDR